MSILRLQSLIWLLGSAYVANGAEVVYVTDLTIFTELAPCAASAISYNVMSQTYSNCPQAVTALQSCVCSKNNNFASISTALSKSVSYSCGSTASADQASAATVLQAYCNQASVVPFPQPSNPVTQYITDVAEFNNLAPCVASAVSYNVMSMTYDLCPENPSQLATCVCQKNQNSLLVSQGINTSARYSCSSHTADISSAQAFFAAYCGMNNGTSSFPATSNPPGDMTYYITGLAEYSSLAPCAQSAVSYGVFTNTYDLCPAGPQALASCACIKEGMPSYISSMIRSDVKYSCESTATEDVTSALAVWDLYCSAAKGLATPTGVTDSIAQPQATAKAGSTGGASGPRATSTGADSTQSTDAPPIASASITKVSTGAIVGGIVVGVAVIGAIGGVYFILWKRRKAREEQINQAFTFQHHQPNNSNNNPSAGSYYNGKPELDSTVMSVRPNTAGTGAGLSPSPSMIKLNPMPPRTDYYHSSSNSNSTAELHAQTTHYSRPSSKRSELGVNQHPYAQRPSMDVHEAPAQQRPQMYEVPAGQGVIQPQRAELHGMGWQSGPVDNTYYEMDGGEYHANSSRR